MKTSVKARKIGATIIDIFTFSLLVRIIWFSGYQLSVPADIFLIAGLIIGGTITYVFVPLKLNKQTLGMKVNGLIFCFTKRNTGKIALVLTVRFFSQFFLNIIFLGSPLAINLFFLLWRKDGMTMIDKLFSRVMMNQELD